MLETILRPFAASEKNKSYLGPGAVFTKGLSQVSGLRWLYFCTKVKPKTWLRPFVNAAPGLYSLQLVKDKQYLIVSLSFPLTLSWPSHDKYISIIP